MNEVIQKITEMLSSLRAASILYHNTPESLMNQYNLMFLGDKFNIIYSDDLLDALHDNYHMDISKALLETLLPKICVKLNMKCEPMKSLKDMKNPKPYCYQITLW